MRSNDDTQRLIIKVEKMSESLARIEGKLEATLPHLATKNHLQIEMNRTLDKHHKSCSHALTGKTVIKIAGLFIPISAVISVLVKLFTF